MSNVPPPNNPKRSSRVIVPPINSGSSELDTIPLLSLPGSSTVMEIALSGLVAGEFQRLNLLSTRPLEEVETIIRQEILTQDTDEIINTLNFTSDEYEQSFFWILQNYSNPNLHFSNEEKKKLRGVCLEFAMRMFDDPKIFRTSYRDPGSMEPWWYYISSLVNLKAELKNSAQTDKTLIGEHSEFIDDLISLSFGCLHHLSSKRNLPVEPKVWLSDGLINLGSTPLAPTVRELMTDKNWYANRLCRNVSPRMLEQFPALVELEPSVSLTEASADFSVDDIQKNWECAISPNTDSKMESWNNPTEGSVNERELIFYAGKPWVWSIEDLEKDGRELLKKLMQEGLQEPSMVKPPTEKLPDPLEFQLMWMNKIKRLKRVAIMDNEACLGILFNTMRLKGRVSTESELKFLLDDNFALKKGENNQPLKTYLGFEGEICPAVAYSLEYWEKLWDITKDNGIEVNFFHKGVSKGNKKIRDWVTEGLTSKLKQIVMSDSLDDIYTQSGSSSRTRVPFHTFVELKLASFVRHISSVNESDFNVYSSGPGQCPLRIALGHAAHTVSKSIPYGVFGTSGIPIRGNSELLSLADNIPGDNDGAKRYFFYCTNGFGLNTPDKGEIYEPKALVDILFITGDKKDDDKGGSSERAEVKPPSRSKRFTPSLA